MRHGLPEAGGYLLDCLIEYALSERYSGDLPSMTPEDVRQIFEITGADGKWHRRSDPGEHGYAVHDGDTDNNPGRTVYYFNRCRLRYSRGVQPKACRNASLKRLSEPKPELNAMFRIKSSVVTSRRCACDSRC